jgi:hypothetical protein
VIVALDGVEPVVLSVTVGLAHVIVPPVRTAVGGVLFTLTDAVAVAVQPLVVLVTRSLYVPPALTGPLTVVVAGAGPVIR